MRTRQICLLLAFSILGTVEAQAEGCPTAKDDIATDRPDVTNSSLVVPTGSLQNENGVNFSMREDGRTFDGTNSRWRLVAPCLELLVDLPAPLEGVPACWPATTQAPPRGQPSVPAREPIRWPADRIGRLSCNRWQSRGSPVSTLPSASRT